MKFKLIADKETKIYNLLKSNNVSEIVIKKLRTNLENVKINGVPSRVIDFVKRNDVIEIDIKNSISNKIEPTYNKIAVLFEDDYILAVNKDAFLSSIPQKYKLSIAHDILGYLQLDCYMPINRLDTNTSGILLVAKSPYIQHMLTGNFNKFYIAILSKTPSENKFIIDAPIYQDPLIKSKRCIDLKGKQSLTQVEIIEKYNNGACMAKIKLLTGRTHQIRVHLAHIGCSLIGDILYGTASSLINRQALHATNVSFTHPISKKEIIIDCPLPADIIDLINILKL